MRTADKKTSRSIFEQLQKKKENNPNMDVSEGVDREEERQDEVTDVSMVASRSDTKMFSRGAADSMRDREKARRDKEKEVQSIKNKGVKKKIQINESDDFFVDMLKMSAVNEDRGTIVRSLLGLFLSGTLESYEIDGLNKEQIITLIEEFKDEVESVLT